MKSPDFVTNQYPTQEWPQRERLTFDTKPKDLLEYVIVHEMVHLIEPTHSDRLATPAEIRLTHYRICMVVAAREEN